MDSPSCCGLIVQWTACAERQVVFSSDMVCRLATQDVVSTQLDPLGLQSYSSLLKIIGYVLWSSEISLCECWTLGKGMCLSCFDFQVYWAGPLSAGVVAALLYNYLLAPREEPFREQTQVLFCCDPTIENEIREPLLEDAKDWSKRHTDR